MNLSKQPSSVIRRGQFRCSLFHPGGRDPLAGHPTIATVFALVDSGRLAFTGNQHTISLELPAGIIPVEIFTVEVKFSALL
jgi:trans-2,3-dihydro-3-hydroxyanthranilate isomerase